ncbi:MAG TPA: glycosyltransferase family 4 protein [Chloroflexota bacterium]|nr:glycosyltransferase family 4 protein [Chloroflexota bacterium]
MKILFLTPRFPYPLDGGTNLRNFRLIQSAAEEHEVHLLSLLDRPIRPPDMEPVEARCQRVELYPAPNHSPFRRLTTTLGSRLPDMAYRCWSARLANGLRPLLQQERYDLIQVEGIEMARYLPLCRGARRVFDDHNVEHLLQRRAYQVDRAHPGRWPKAAYSLIQSEKLARFERAACRLADCVLAVSPEDREALAALEPSGRYSVVPNAIDTNAYPPRAERQREPCLLFTGTLDFRPNVDAVEWFLDEVFPLVRRTCPEIRALVVGRGPGPGLVARCQHDPKIAVTGPVESLEPYWQRASIYVLPMRSGGGVRFKALEAMAAGVPIVSTRLGMEGIAAEADTHYLMADTAEGFAAAIQSLLGKPELGARLASEARRLVAERHDWRAVAPSLLAVYRELA